ncbi:hypothetical protein JCM8547_003715 [Rhodosporidiobolus lusitaniae]
MSDQTSTASPPPLALDHSRNTYFVLSTSSSSPPQLPALASASADPAAPPAPTLSYVGSVGPGLLAQERVVALPVPPTDENAELVQRAKTALRGVEGVQRVELMEVKQRRKR